MGHPQPAWLFASAAIAPQLPQRDPIYDWPDEEFLADIKSLKGLPDEVLAFLSGWGGRAPVVVVPTTYYHWHVKDAQTAGVSMVIYANQGLRACVRSMRRAWNNCASRRFLSVISVLITSLALGLPSGSRTSVPTKITLL